MTKLWKIWVYHVIDGLMSKEMMIMLSYDNNNSLFKFCIVCNSKWFLKKAIKILRNSTKLLNVENSGSSYNQIQHYGIKTSTNQNQ